MANIKELGHGKYLLSLLHKIGYSFFSSFQVKGEFVSIPSLEETAKSKGKVDFVHYANGLKYRLVWDADSLMFTLYSKH